MQYVNIIGSGFSSLSAACYLADSGFEVNLFEKNKSIGGRARKMVKDGFIFDMGPSWYWMPDVFDNFFRDFGKKTSDFYELKRLAPAYRVYFEDGTSIDIPDSLDEIFKIFEKEEPGAGKILSKFLEGAGNNYRIAMKNLVYKPGISPLELVTFETIKKLDQFVVTISRQIRKRFKNPKLIKILEFPVLFLGAKPQDTPAFYNFMNHADFVLGTWYPLGGMHKVVEAMETLALSLGVKIHTGSNVQKIATEDGKIKGLVIDDALIPSDVVLSGADYHHTETLLPFGLRSYKNSYWQKKTFAPSSLLFYVGFDKKLSGILHHMLFFDTDFEAHASAIYDDPKWPKSPLFYASFTSLTDSSVAPHDRESGFFLIPLAPGLEDSDTLREKYFNMILERLEKHTNQSIKPFISFKESYCLNDFIQDYNSYKGNAYGMANTLLQTAFLRPKIISKKVENLYFTGQLTVPGPGVPPSLISGKIAAELISQNTHQKV
ncbi:MAG: phytoene dehydrogenase [Flammeovirgaceae bacterium]|nr:phytoene dehydrogenase [Flammeovirgaceae bacterium]